VDGEREGAPAGRLVAGNLVSERERVYRVMAFQLSFFVSHFFLSLLRAVS